MGNRLEGRTAIVTGGAGGVGLAIARGFADEGATVHVADIGQDRCEDACRAIGKNAIPQPFDLRDVGSIRAMVERVASRSSRIDILVQCAAVVSGQLIKNITPEEFDRVFSINVRGLTFTLAEVAKRMMADGKGGAIINFTSGSGKRGQSWISVYSASKFAVVGMSQSAAVELIPYGIRVNAIAPGPIRTQLADELLERMRDDNPGEPLPERVRNGFQSPIGYMSEPEDYVGTALLLATDEGRYIVGQTISVDGGIVLS